MISKQDLKDKIQGSGAVFIWVVVVTIGVMVFLSSQNDSSSGQVAGSVVEEREYLQGREEYYSEEFWEEYYRY